MTDGIMRFTSQNRTATGLPTRIRRRLGAAIRALDARASDWEWQARCFRMNQCPEMSISRRAFITKSAKLRIKAEGVPYGGRIQISDGVCLSDGVLLAPYGGSIDIEEKVWIGPYCVLYGHGGLTIGRDTMIAAHTVIIPSNHTFADPNQTVFGQPSTHKGIHIGQDVWIGCGVRILDGVSIGRGCVIGAGAVVTKSLPDYSIAFGVPAQVRGIRGQEGPAARSAIADPENTLTA